MRKLFCIGIFCIALLCLAACGEALPEESSAIDTAASEQTSEFAGESSSSENLTDESTAQESTAPVIPADAPVHSANGTSKPGTTAKTQAGETASEAQSVRVTIPEGFSFYQTAKRLEANAVCSAKDFFNTAQAYQIQSFPAPISAQSCYRMEGMLYPDTYEFYVGETPATVLRKMLNNYAEKSGLPSYDMLILASIIERETRSSEHMAMVSSVFHNRLQQGMPLQADATIAYVEEHIKSNALVRSPGQYAERYNTYKCKALPVGPICNPSRRAINAALNPSQSDYLYYFFGSDNTNHYSKTYEEHKAAIARVGLG